MRTPAFSLLLVASSGLVLACRSAPPPPAPAPRPLSDSASAALAWVQSHAQQFTISDSVARGRDREQIVALAGDARIVGVSELTEGTREFPLVVRRMLFTLADSLGFRGLAIQAPMPEVMEIDRYIRTGSGDLNRMLRTLGNPRWESREMAGVVNAIRDWNRAHPDKQIGFYGFEIPTAARALDVVTSLPDSITGRGLKTWLTREYECVRTSESAHWGLEGRTSDSTFWNRCGEVAKAALDSIVALRARVGSSPRGAAVAYAEQMARLIQLHASLSLRHVNRHESNAERLLYLANSLGSDAKLLVWGGDLEMGRLTLDSNTVQTGVPLGARLGARYRAVGFVFGDGAIRTRRLGSGRGGAQPGLSDVPIAPPLPNTYEDVLIRTSHDAFWLDVRTLPTDIAGAWLRGPRRLRQISETSGYVPAAPELTETPVELPANYDAFVYVRRVTPARP